VYFRTAGFERRPMLQDTKPDLTVEESTAKQLALIRRLTPADSGKFISAADDKELPF